LLVAARSASDLFVSVRYNLAVAALTMVPIAVAAALSWRESFAILLTSISGNAVHQAPRSVSVKRGGRDGSSSKRLAPTCGCSSKAS
jgi:hypothetical protein